MGFWVYKAGFSVTGINEVILQQTILGLLKRLELVYKYIVLWKHALSRVANLAFLKPDVEILTFFQRTWLFLKIERSQTKSGFFGFFSVGKAWLWQNIELHIHYKPFLTWACKVQRALQRFYCCFKNVRCI